MYVTDVLDTEGEATAAAIGGSPPTGTSTSLDEEAGPRQVRDPRKRHGRIDVLVNNAGSSG
ncbi:MAG: hypothetical protein H6518_15760 [Microthrixaceae bacterium]|nr:hypothetical protein [Microthrixaceae bacterium]